MNQVFDTNTCGTMKEEVRERRKMEQTGKSSVENKYRTHEKVMCDNKLSDS